VEANTTDELRQEMSAALAGCWERLAASMDARMPRSLRSVISGDDIVSETWDEANRIIGTRPGTRPCDWDGWFHALAYGKLGHAVRSACSQRHGGGQPGASLDEAEGSLDAKASAAWRHDVEDTERADAIERAVGWLKPVKRRAIRLYLAGRSERGIAGELRSSAAAVDSVLRRAREDLRPALHQNSDHRCL